MRMVFGIACGITVSIVAYAIWQPALGPEVMARILARRAH